MSFTDEELARIGKSLEPAEALRALVFIQTRLDMLADSLNALVRVDRRLSTDGLKKLLEYFEASAQTISQSAKSGDHSSRLAVERIQANAAVLRSLLTTFKTMDQEAERISQWTNENPRPIL